MGFIQPKRGWGYVGRKAHYILESGVLCGRAKAGPIHRSASWPDDHKDNCHHCKVRKAKLEAAGIPLTALPAKS